MRQIGDFQVKTDQACELTFASTKIVGSMKGGQAQWDSLHKKNVGPRTYTAFRKLLLPQRRQIWTMRCHRLSRWQGLGTNAMVYSTNAMVKDGWLQEFSMPVNYLGRLAGMSKGSSNSFTSAGCSSQNHTCISCADMPYRSV